jgi:hypothetical protein
MHNDFTLVQVKRFDTLGVYIDKYSNSNEFMKDIFVFNFLAKIMIAKLRFFEKNSEKTFPRKQLKQMVPSESAPQELSKEWSCQYISTILHFLSNFCVPPLVTEVTISA